MRMPCNVPGPTEDLFLFGRGLGRRLQTNKVKGRRRSGVKTMDVFIARRVSARRPTKKTGWLFWEYSPSAG